MVQAKEHQTRHDDRWIAALSKKSQKDRQNTHKSSDYAASKGARQATADHPMLTRDTETRTSTQKTRLNIGRVFTGESEFIDSYQQERAKHAPAFSN
jgi:hypothetical protein